MAKLEVINLIGGILLEQVDEMHKIGKDKAWIAQAPRTSRSHGSRARQSTDLKEVGGD